MPSSPDSGPIRTWAPSDSTSRRASDSALVGVVVRAAIAHDLDRVAGERPAGNAVGRGWAVGLCPVVRDEVRLGAADVGVVPGAKRPPKQSDRMPILIAFDGAAAAARRRRAGAAAAAALAATGCDPQPAQRKAWYYRQPPQRPPPSPSTLQPRHLLSDVCHLMTSKSDESLLPLRPLAPLSSTARLPAQLLPLPEELVLQIPSPARERGPRPVQPATSPPTLWPMPINPSGDSSTISRKTSPMIVSKLAWTRANCPLLECTGGRSSRSACRRWRRATPPPAATARR